MTDASQEPEMRMGARPAPPGQAGGIARQLSLGATDATAELPQGGAFVVVEGGEGAGKSTLIARLQERATASGLVTVAMRDPGGTDLGERVRELLRATGEATDPRAELLLFAAARAALVTERIVPALQQGKLVLCDRFSGSMLAYQHHARGIARGIVEQADAIAKRGLSPDLTLLLDLDPEVGLRRVRRRGALDRMEREALEFHALVRAGFRAEAERSARRWIILDAADPPAAVEEQAWAAIGEIAGME